MKKLLLFCLLVGGISSFTNVKAENALIKTPSADIGYCCTATVYHNGVPVTSFTSCGQFACMVAGALACEYIEQSGGTCPQHQL